ncbi:hypothetical protein ACWDWU_25320 [Streptomyces sp. NPDC003442]
MTTPWELSATGAGAAFLAPATAMASAGPVAGRIRTAEAVLLTRIRRGCGPRARRRHAFLQK